MSITLDQHFDITWLAAFIVVLLVLSIGDLVRSWHTRRLIYKSQKKVAHLTRHSFLKV